MTVPAGTRSRAEAETARESRELNEGPAERTERSDPRPRQPKPVQERSAPRQAAPAAGGTQRAVKMSAPSYHNYQGIILAEFILAELLVAGTPIAVRKNQPGLSPYIPRDMTKLLALGIVYFLLQLTAVGGNQAGRYGAWFGGLILLAVGVNEAANVTKVLGLFSKVGQAASAEAGKLPDISKGLHPFGKGTT